MKLANKNALGLPKHTKSGLSIVLAVVLLGNITQPGRVLAASSVESAPAVETVAEPAPEAPETPPTVQQTLLRICQERGLDETCAKHLLGILMQESQGKANAVGDYGMARGWFQINRYYHPTVSLQCAEDLECSAEWTLEHLIKKGYLRTAKWAIWCHNGCGISKTYVNKVLYKGQAAWDQPMHLAETESDNILALK